MKHTLIWGLVIVVVLFISFFVFSIQTSTTSEIIVEDLPNMEIDSLDDTTPTPGTSAGVDASAGTVKEFTINGTNFAFEPSLITVKKGDKVKITFNSTQGFHDFVVDEFGAATKQIQSPGTEVIEFVADKAGSFEYYCSVGSHRKMGMVGTLKVQ